MALPASGLITMQNIATEFGGASPHSLSEYYGVAAGIPTSGLITMNQFHGKSAVVEHGMNWTSVFHPGGGSSNGPSRNGTVGTAGGGYLYYHSYTSGWPTDYSGWTQYGMYYNLFMSRGTFGMSGMVGMRLMLSLGFSSFSPVTASVYVQEASGSVTTYGLGYIGTPSDISKISSYSEWLVIGQGGRMHRVPTVTSGGTPIALASGTTQNLNSVDYGYHALGWGNLIVGNGGVMKHMALITPVNVTSGTTTNLNGVGYHQGIGWVVVGDGGLILTSPDGASGSWVQRASGTTQNLRAVTKGIEVPPAAADVAVKSVIVGDGGTILTSLDTVTWTPRVSGTTNNLTAVSRIYNNSTYRYHVTGGGSWVS